MGGEGGGREVAVREGVGEIGGAWGDAETGEAGGDVARGVGGGAERDGESLTGVGGYS